MQVTTLQFSEENKIFLMMNHTSTDLTGIIQRKKMDRNRWEDAMRVINLNLLNKDAFLPVFESHPASVVSLA